MTNSSVVMFQSYAELDYYSHDILIKLVIGLQLGEDGLLPYVFVCDQN